MPNALTFDKHAVTWAEDRIVGFQCDGELVSQLLHAEGDPVLCMKCQKKVRVVWDVRIEEVPE